jgi:hypothetical protein
MYKMKPDIGCDFNKGFLKGKIDFGNRVNFHAQKLSAERKTGGKNEYERGYTAGWNNCVEIYIPEN